MTTGAMMTDMLLPPALILILGAPLLLVFGGWARKALILGLPLITFGLIWSAPTWSVPISTEPI